MVLASAQQSAATAAPPRDPQTKIYQRSVSGTETVSEQKQPWPGIQGKMTPKSDCGETSYRGSGRLVGRKALVSPAAILASAAPPRSPSHARA